MPSVFVDTDKPSHSLLHTLCYYPNTMFEGKHEHEVVVLTLRSHPLTQIGWMFTSLVGMILPLFLDIFLVGKLTASTLFFFHIFWWALVISFAFYSLMRWIFNVGIVTNERVIDVDYLFIQKEVTEAAMFDISDITAKTTGFFQDLFNFGDVFVQTASTKQNIEFLNVPKPNEVVKAISQFAKDAHGNN